jgi:hypothetical protein
MSGTIVRQGMDRFSRTSDKLRRLFCFLAALALPVLLSPGHSQAQSKAIDPVEQREYSLDDLVRKITPGKSAR